MNLLYGQRAGLQWCSMGVHVFPSCTGHCTATVVQLDCMWVWYTYVRTYVHAPHVSLQFSLQMYHFPVSCLWFFCLAHITYLCPLVSSWSLYIPTSPTVFVVSSLLHNIQIILYILNALCIMFCTHCVYTF